VKEGANKTPIACSLTTLELRDREARLLAQFRSALIGTEEIQDGYAFHLPGEDKWIRLVVELIVSERECCPFLTFKVTALPNMGPVIVRVTGPAGAKEFLRTLLSKPEEST
jgi:hypothetical protein